MHELTEMANEASGIFKDVQDLQDKYTAFWIKHREQIKKDEYEYRWFVELFLQMKYLYNMAFDFKVTANILGDEDYLDKSESA